MATSKAAAAVVLSGLRPLSRTAVYGPGVGGGVGREMGYRGRGSVEKTTVLAGSTAPVRLVKTPVFSGASVMVGDCWGHDASTFDGVVDDNNNSAGLTILTRCRQDTTPSQWQHQKGLSKLGSLTKNRMYRQRTRSASGDILAGTASDGSIFSGSQGLGGEEEEEEEEEEDKQMAFPPSKTKSVREEKKSVKRSLKGISITSFCETLSSSGLAPLTRRGIGTLQLNIGLFCNQACTHCHVESSPLRTEMMDEQTASRIVHLLEESNEISVVDLTGGAPELNQAFRYLVREARRLGKQVIDRCNLTVLFVKGQEDLADFLAENQVRVVASLPCYSAENVSKQRGGGVFEQSIGALQKLNSLGYGKEGSPLQLDLVYNPLGAFLPPAQDVLQEAYKRELFEGYGITFNNLFALTNMPIKRFADYLLRKGELESYMNLLVSNFNLAAVDGVMCRDMISVRWDGALFDCDFNQQLGLGVPDRADASSVFKLESFDQLIGRPIAIDDHCYGCTAGHGSSCTGAVAT